jgi:GNAT superfamily N-acetyltransferase
MQELPDMAAPDACGAPDLAEPLASQPTANGSAVAASSSASKAAQALQLRLRTATPQDADAVSALLAASYPQQLQGWYDADMLQAVMPHMLAANPKLLDSGSYYLLETHDSGQLIACGGWTKGVPFQETGRSASDADKTGHVRHVAVHADWVGCGVGTRLMTEIVAAAVAEGMHTLEVFSTLNAQRYYARQGFEYLSHTTVCIDGKAFPCVSMVRALR